MDKTVSDPNFAGMAVFTPVINGEVLASAAGGKERGRRKGRGAFVSVRTPAARASGSDSSGLYQRGCSQSGEPGRDPEISNNRKPSSSRVKRRK